MAEREFIPYDNEPQNDVRSASEPDSDSSLFDHLQRLEARFHDAHLAAANNSEDLDKPADYPVDAFYRACARHLQFGIACELEEIAAAAWSENADNPDQPQSRPPMTPRSTGKGPSYTL